MDLEFYWDERGDPRARPREAPQGEAAARSTAVAGYLQSDVQSNASQARQLVHTIDRVLAGRLESWGETGNAHSLALSSHGAVITLELDDRAKPVHLPLDDLRQAVAGWLEFLSRGRSGGGGVPA